MGRGSSKAGGGGGVDSQKFFNRDITPQVDEFNKVVPEDLRMAFLQYGYGLEGGAEKAKYDKANGLSDFIDSKAANPLRVSDNPILYRGGTITDEEFKALKVGGTLDIMDSKDQMTSWSTREMVAHMYAEQSKLTWGQGGNKPHDVVIVDNTKTKDGIVYPFTYPQNEVLRSRRKKYKITKIVDESKYTKPIGREKDGKSQHTDPVTYIYVESR